MKKPMDHTNESDEATHSYRDRLRQLLTTTSSERRSIWSLPGSSTGSVKDDPNQDDSQSSEEEDASMDGYSNAGEPQDMGTTAPKQLVNIGMVMTCVADLDERAKSTKCSLQNQQSWNEGMQQDMEGAQETIQELKSAVATSEEKINLLEEKISLLEENVRVLWLGRNQGNASENRKVAPSNQQTRNGRR
ncbi:hypothetical protein N7513_001862 [Penicillium frequentans]|nr:hypothetical protein N7513_001862 [Penicillium glabrum]